MKKNKKSKKRIVRGSKKAAKVSGRKRYVATIKIMGKFFNAEGKSVFEAIANLKVKNVRGISILTVEHGEKKKERILPFFITTRLFNLSGMTREITLKNVAARFDI